MTTTIEATSPLPALAAELKRQKGTARDLMADTRHVSFSEPSDPLPEGRRVAGPMLIDLPGGAEAFSLTRHAHGQVATHLGIPQKFYDRLLGEHPDLHATVANELLSREPSTRRLRILDGRVRAFLSDKYRPRDNWDLMEQAVLPALAAAPNRVEFKQCDLTETRMYIKCFMPEVAAPVTPAVGDVVRCGVIISNSEVGAGALGVFPYTDILRCLNGMVHTEYGKRSRHVGRRVRGDDGDEAWEVYSDETIKLDDAAFFAKCRDLITASLNETVFDAIVKDMRDLAGIKVEGDPVAAVEILSDRVGMTENERGSMMAALVEGADLTAWGYVNALTRTARDTEDADRQTELEVAAGKLTRDHAWAVALAA